MFIHHEQLNKKSETGLSLIEASMVLALSAIVISGVMVYYHSASENIKIKDTSLLIQSVNNVVINLFDGRSASYSELERNDSKIIFTNSINIPNKYKVNGEIKTPFGGEIHVYKERHQIGNSSITDTYGLRITKVPTSACITLGMLKLNGTHQKTTFDTWDKTGVTDQNRTPETVAKLCEKYKNDKGEISQMSYLFESISIPMKPKS